MPNKNNHILLIVDLEATCDENNRMDRNEMEIIEIGAAKFCLEKLVVLDKFSALIKPLRNPKLTVFCEGLTGIKQNDADHAASVYEVFPQFSQWVKNQQEPVLWGSWGAYDRNQFAQDCKHFRLESPVQMPYLNLKYVYGIAINGRKKLGLANSLKREHMQFEGNHHRALDDALNVARIIVNNDRFANALREKLQSTNTLEP